MKLGFNFKVDPLNYPWWYEFIPLWITLILTAAIVGLLALLYNLTGTATATATATGVINCVP